MKFKKNRSVLISVAVRNGSLPVIRSVPTGPAILGKEYVYAVDAYDPYGDTLTYSLVSPVAGASINTQPTAIVTARDGQVARRDKPLRFLPVGPIMIVPIP